MRNLKQLLVREPAAVGTLVASILPVLVMLGVIHNVGEEGVAAIVVAVNAVVGFGIRLLVSPGGAPQPASQPAPAGATLAQ